MTELAALTPRPRLLPAGTDRVMGWLTPFVLAAVLTATSRYSWALFHTLAEMFTVIIATMVAVVAWQAYPFSRNNFLTFAAAGLFWAGALDIVHALQYEGFGVMPGSTQDKSNAYWIVARGLQSTTLLIAPLFLTRDLPRQHAFAAIGALALLAGAAIETGVFPTMYVPGQGQTALKIGGEYLMIALLGGALVHLWMRRALLDERIFRVVSVSLVISMVSELMFTLYLSPVGSPYVLVGHILKVWAYWALFLGIVATTLTAPFRALARGASTYDAVPDPTIVVDRTGAVCQTNKAARALVTLDEASCIGRHVHGLFHPVELAVSDCAVCERIRAGVAEPGMELEFAGGVWRVITLSPIESGDVNLGMVHVSRDISARKRAEQALRDSEQRFRTLVETSQDIIWETDAQMRFTYVSPRIEQILGYSSFEVLGLHPEELMPPAEGVRVVSAVADLAARRQPVFALENVNLTRDGREVILDTNAVPRFDTHGRFCGYSGIDRDITQRKRDEQALRRSQARLAEAQRVGRIGSWELDPAGHDSSWSEECCRLHGYRPGEVAPGVDALLSRVHPDDRARVRQALEQALAGAFSELTVEHRLLLPDGTERYMQKRMRVDRDLHGKVERVVGATVDVTELRRAQEEVIRLNADLERRVAERTSELEVANRELESFSYSVSHDLRAPLRSIDGFSQLLLRKYENGLDGTGRDYLNRVRNATGRMGRLIDDLLKLSRVIRSDFLRGEVDLSQLAAEVVRELADAEPQRAVAVQVTPGLTDHGDARLLRVVLDNLIGNAWKFSSRTAVPRIEFGAEPHGPGRAYFVRDNGAGFDMNYAEKLFGAFQRLHSESEFAGTGIGLATVQRIIHRHGGKVWAHGEPGRGATFYFTLGNSAP